MCQNSPGHLIYPTKLQDLKTGGLYQNAKIWVSKLSGKSITVANLRPLAQIFSTLVEISNIKQTK